MDITTLPPLSPLLITSLELSQLLLVTATVPFYLFLLFFMVHAQFRKVNEFLATPFFKLCISTAIIDLSTLFANYFGVMFPKFGWFFNFYTYLDAIYAHIYFYIAWSTGTSICQAMSVSVLATNRLSAMIFPGEYAKLWSSHRLWIVISIQFLPGMTIGAVTFFNTTQLFITDNNGIIPKFSDKQFTLIFFSVGGFFLLINCIYLIIAYCYLFISLHKRNRKMIPKTAQSKPKDKVIRRERRLFIMCSIIVAVQLLILVFFVVKTMGWFRISLDEFYVLYTALSSLFASINPYLLWIFSDSLRKYVQEKLRWKFQGSSPAITTTAYVLPMITDLYSLPQVVIIGEPLDETLEKVVETIQFSIFCITVPLYIFITWILLHAQLRGVEELSTPFFKLCVTTAIIDIWTLLNNYLGAMFPKWGWGIRIYLFLDQYYAHVYLYFAWTSGICQAMSVSVLATNRLSAILFPNKHYLIWNSSRLRIAIALQFLPGMLAGLATIPGQTQLYRNSKNGVIPKFKDEKMVTYFFLIAGVFLTVICVYLIFAYCYLLVMLRKNRNAIKNTQFQKSKSAIKKKELKLFIMSSITVAIQISALCLFVSYATSILIISLDKFYLLYNAISDLYAGINPYLLWIFSDSLRKHILIRVGFKRSGRRQPTSSVITVIH